MLDSVKLWLAQFYGYVLLAILAVLLVVATFLRIEVLKYRAEVGKYAAAQTALKTSNLSITSLQSEMDKIRDQLQANAGQEAAHQAVITKELWKAKGDNVKLQALADKLRARMSTSGCFTPQDLKDAWNAL